MAQAMLLSTALSSVLLIAQPAAAEDKGDTISLDEVVVTARKRAENLQSTPVSVTALSGDITRQLNVQNFQDLRGAVPNLEITPLTTGGAAMTIRGIGQINSQVNVDAKAGFYVDEMYVARQEGNQLYFYDIDSLQVLKGPQGTLFGKNTTAGAVLLSTARPGPEAGGFVRVRAGSFDRLDTEGAINIPLSDNFLTRISFRTQNTDGYIKHALDDDTSNNINDKSIRLQTRFTPTSRLVVDTLAEYNRSETKGSTTIMIGCRPTAPYMNNYNALHSVRLCDAYPVLNKHYTVYGGATLSIPTSSALTDVAKGGDFQASGLTRFGHPTSFNDTEVSTLNNRITYDVTDEISVKSITAYRNSAASWYNPTLNAPNDIYGEFDNTHTRQFTQEFNLNGRAFDDRLNYVVGAYFFDQKTFLLQDTGPDWIDPVGYTYEATNHFKSWALYAQASFKITEPLELTLGGRYSHDRKSAVSDVALQTVTTAPCNGFANAFRQGFKVCGGHLLGEDEESWSSFDPRAQLSYQFTPDIFAYASATRGYNAGGFNQQLGSNVARGSLISYDPEKVWSYEAGLKTQWWDRRVRANVSAFYQKYDDIQTTVLIEINGSNTRQVQTGATAHEQGLEAELELLPTPDLVVRANAAYLDQAYDSIRPGVSFTLQTPVTSAAKFTYALSADYTFHLGSEATLVAGLNWRAVGKKPRCNAANVCIDLPAYGLLGGRLDYRPSGDSPWTVGVWGTNLLDRYVQLDKLIGGSMGVDAITPGRPREVGVEVRRTF
ncbi:MAG TPA: TonB-dependent receptor [Phenylobacterium sp.]